MSDRRAPSGAKKTGPVKSLACGVASVVSGTRAMVRILYRDNSADTFVVTFDPLQPVLTSTASPIETIHHPLLLIMFISMIQNS
jgi:hypothetical protein